MSYMKREWERQEFGDAAPDVRFGEAGLCQWHRQFEDVPECNAPRDSGTGFCAAHLPLARLWFIEQQEPACFVADDEEAAV